MKWISVYNQLPEKYDDYLTLDALGVVAIAHFNMEGFHIKNGKILYWMPLPSKNIEPNEMKNANIKGELFGNVEELKKLFLEQRAQQIRVEEGYKTLVSLTEAYLDQACQKLCGVLYQLYTGYAEEDAGVYRTSFNYDADAVWFLKEHGYVTVSDGEWPRTKYLSFSFMDKFKR